jgi:hypothetical protein
MKAKGIVVLTVGFELGTTAVKDLMKQCATSETYAYLVSNVAAQGDVPQHRDHLAAAPVALGRADGILTVALTAPEAPPLASR